MNRWECFQAGKEAVTEFLDHNNLFVPPILEYGEVKGRVNALVQKFFDRATADAELVGRRTGLYGYGHIFVNVPVTALPVARPSMRSWSWPGYKVDRTAVGVVAHEAGHYVEHKLQELGRLDPKTHGERWRQLIELTKKTVSGYEPVPSEAWAESMRLFILNPALLKEGSPARYGFIYEVVGLRPLPRLLRKGWRRVLANENYFAAAERWVAA